MALDMLNSAAMAEALRLLCQSKVKLTANCAASATVTVGSTELFRAVPAVYPLTSLSIAAVLDDSDSCAEPVTISQITNLTTLVLSSACAGTFTTAKSAIIRLGTQRVTFGASASIGEGWFEFPEQVAANKLPAITVIEDNVDEGPGTLGHTQFIHNFRVLYARQKATDEISPRALKLQLEALHDLLREDIYLGGTADNVEITAIEARPPEDMPYEHQNIDVGFIGLAVHKYVLHHKQ